MRTNASCHLTPEWPQIFQKQENLRTDKEALEGEAGLFSFSLLLTGNEWFHRVTYSHRYADSRGRSEVTWLTDHALRPGRWRDKVNLLHSHINIPRHSVIVIESWWMQAEKPAVTYLLPGTGLFPSGQWGTPCSCDTCWPAPQNSANPGASTSQRGCNSL